MRTYIGTSKPYPMLFEDSVGFSLSEFKGEIKDGPYLYENIGAGLFALESEISSFSTAFHTEESFSVGLSSFDGYISAYQRYPLLDERMLLSVTPQTSEIRNLIQYLNWPIESMGLGLSNFEGNIS